MSNKTRQERQLSSFPRYRHHSAGFILTSFAIASVVATGIFWIMYQLVSIVQVTVPAEDNHVGIDFIDFKEEPPSPPEKRRKPERQEFIDMPLPVELGDWTGGPSVPGFTFPGQHTFPPLEPHKGGPIGIGEREYMPLSEFQPQYPQRLLSKGLEGSCVVIYTISKSGSVSDVRVDKSRCTHALFERASVKAAHKFKYAPRIVDGQTVEARNVTKLFRFSITE